MLRRWSKPARARIEARRAVAWIGEAEAEIGFEPAGADYAQEAQALVAALDALVAGGARMPARLDLEIADFHVHYDVFEADVRGIAAADAVRLAGRALEEALGLPEGRLAVRAERQARGASLVACGMPAALLTALRGACDSRALVLDHARPAFAGFLDRHAKRLRGEDAVLARRDGSELMLALRQRGGWRGFSRERLAGDGWADFSRACAAFCLRLGAPDAARIPVWFDAELRGDMPQGERAWHRITERNAP